MVERPLYVNDIQNNVEDVIKRCNIDIDKTRFYCNKSNLRFK